MVCGRDRWRRPGTWIYRNPGDRASWTVWGGLHDLSIPFFNLTMSRMARLTTWHYPRLRTALGSSLRIYHFFLCDFHLLFRILLLRYQIFDTISLEHLLFKYFHGNHPGGCGILASNRIRVLSWLCYLLMWVTLLYMLVSSISSGIIAFRRYYFQLIYWIHCVETKYISTDRLHV